VSSYGHERFKELLLHVGHNDEIFKLGRFPTSAIYYRGDHIVCPINYVRPFDECCESRDSLEVSLLKNSKRTV
jgi:hypothetical protein